VPDMQRSRSRDLSPLWLRAALLGSTWASVEIVLGSFLHNLRLPFAGTLLASIGIVILVAGQRIWPERGLLWRAGIICALMKSISPSAVIIGPMIGIISEAVVVELVVRVVGMNVVGFVFAGAAAALLPPAQMIVSMVITYGPDIARLYVRVVDFAAKTLAMSTLGPAELLMVYAGVSLLLGCSAALSGFVVGGRVLTIPTRGAITNGAHSPFAPGAVDPHQPFSLTLLAMHAAAMVLGFFAIRVLPFWASFAYVVLYVLLALGLYPAVVKKLSRMRLWMEFAVISLLAGWLLGGGGNPGDGFHRSGLIIGAEMSLRASLVVVGFTAVGIELRNPIIIEWFLRRGLGQLARALEVAFEALPHMIGAFGDQKRFFRSPLQALSRTIASGVEWLATLEGPSEPMVFLVTGETAVGKTTFLSKLVQILIDQGVSVGGFLAPAVMIGDDRSGFDVFDIRTGTSAPLCRRSDRSSALRAGPFVFDTAGFAFGSNALAQALAEGLQVLCIDEVGPLEIDGHGWASALRQVLASHHGALLLVVRSRLVARSQESFGFHARGIWTVTDTVPAEAANRLLTALRSADSHIEAGGVGGPC
jgi:nucleoside-triphosphatase THEP1